jgi:hypothetical protein
MSGWVRWVGGRGGMHAHDVDAERGDKRAVAVNDPLVVLGCRCHLAQRVCVFNDDPQNVMACLKQLSSRAC